MSSMLDPQQYNKDMRDAQLDLVIKAMGPASEKSAFILALMILQAPDPVAYMNRISSAIDKLYSPSGNGDKSTGSTFHEMSLMYQQAYSIYMKIRDF